MKKHALNIIPAQLFALLFAPLASLQAAVRPLSDFQNLVHAESWIENRPDAVGQSESRTVTAEVWTKAMQAVLDAQNTVHIPARAQPYYLDEPLVLKSGQKLTADPNAEIRLKPGCNTCMVRNEHIVGFADQSVPADTKPDTDITIEGGIWTTLPTGDKAANGNMRGASSKQNPVPGTHGVTLDRHGRDGVHVDGPASNGVIRHVSGDSYDDPVSLTTWDWWQYSVTFGPIHHLTIEDITGAPDEKHGFDAIRLLPGVKRFSDCTTLDRPISDITLRRITDIREFKLYDQPNLELGRDNDSSVGIGTLKNIRFEDLTFNRPGIIEVHANTDGLVIQTAKLNFPVAPDFHLLALGPKSQTYKHGGPDAPDQWTEIFSPDLDCNVRYVTITGVRTRDSQTDLPIEQVVKVIEQKLNPNYPKTAPRGGTAKGIWIR